MGIQNRIQAAKQANERAANDAAMCEFQARYERKIAEGQPGYDYSTLKTALREMRENPQVDASMFFRMYGV